MIIKRQKKSGVAFIMALAIMFMLLSLGMAYVIIARSQSVITSNQRDALKAFYIAEAGAEAALDQLFIKSSWDVGYKDEDFAGGVYNVSLLEDTETGIITITSEGEFGGAFMTLRTEVLRISGLDFTQFSGTTVGTGGNATFAGSRGKIKGLVVIEGDFTQGNMDIDDARIIDNFEGLPRFKGKFKDDFIKVDFNLYEEDADYVYEEEGAGKGKGKGKGKSFTKTFKSGETVLPGVHYVRGDVVIESNVSIDGTIIADSYFSSEGDITINDNVTITAEGYLEKPVDGYPAIIARGDINIDQTTNTKTDITGVVYAHENINVDNVNDVTFTGGIIAGKNLNASNCEKLFIYYDKDMEFRPPYFTFPTSAGTEEPTIAVISWKAYPG